jgi:hypothetical protein
MSEPMKAEPETDFVAAFREGEAVAREWLAGKGDLPDLLSIVLDMAREPLGGREAGFLSMVDAAVRGRRTAPDPAKAQMALAPPADASSPDASPTPTVDVDEMFRRRREAQRKAWRDEFWRRNQEGFVEQAYSIDRRRWW